MTRAKRSAPNEGGKLVIRKPWPAMLRTIYGDKERLQETTYWSEVKGCYFTGDGARRDKDGYFWIVGRIDDVLNVAGHRLGTAEVESALGRASEPSPRPRWSAVRTNSRARRRRFCHPEARHSRRADELARGPSQCTSAR